MMRLRTTGLVGGIGLGLLVFFCPALTAGPCGDWRRHATELVIRLESQDPLTITSGAAQSMVESKWESSRQIWTTYDVIDVDSFEVMGCQ